MTFPCQEESYGCKTSSQYNGKSSRSWYALLPWFANYFKNNKGHVLFDDVIPPLLTFGFIKI
jgi:hypothetical protein